VLGRAAQMAHGFEQYNLDIDVLLVTAAGLKAMQQRLPARGFVKLSERYFRDSTTDLDFKVIVAGELAGPETCPIRFPDPVNASVMRNGYRVIDLLRFVELKLASGLRPTRLSDLADVLQLIRTANLPRELSNEIHASVSGEYLRMWDVAATARDPRNE
jgi:hypothetical protein